MTCIILDRDAQHRLRRKDKTGPALIKLESVVIIIIIFIIIIIILHGPNGVGLTVDGLVNIMLVALPDLAADKQVLPRN